MAAGYSKTPLIDKLGIKPGMRVRLIHAPKAYPKLIGPWPANVRIASSLRGTFGFIHLFATSQKQS